MTVSSRLFGANAITHAAVSVALLAAVLGAVFAFSGPYALAEALANVKPSSIILIALLLTAGVGLSSLRLKIIASNLGYTLSLRDAVMALTVGQIAGSLFFQFFGQLIGRTAILAGRGIPPAASVVLFGYERIFALIVSLGLAACGAIYLFGALHFDLLGGGISLVKIGIGILVAVIAGAALAWGRQAARLWRNLLPLLFSRIGWNVLLSVAVQLTTLGAYIVAGKTLLPAIEIVPLAAASAVIMFAASLPISFAGWGLRELSAVVVLQAIGFSNAKALVASLLIGVISLVVLALSAFAFQFLVRPDEPIKVSATVPDRPDYTLALDWILPIAAATAVFFQIYVPTRSGNLNVNLADPAVLIAAMLFVLRHVQSGWPQWRVSKLGLGVIATTIVILVSLLHGFAVIGYTDWAFVNRTLGWGMLLCYAATGALIVERAQRDGYEILLKTFVATGAALSALNIALVALARFGSANMYSEQPRIAGFSQNSNAFAFILLMALAAALMLHQSKRLRTATLTCILVGIWYSGSRAGIGSAVVVIAASVWWGPPWRSLVPAFAIAIVVSVVIWFLPNLAHALSTAGTGIGIDLTAAMPWDSRDFSDNEHFTSVWRGFSLFLSHPIFGAGLGIFTDENLRANGIAMVIHATPVWLLAETGIIGFGIFFAVAFHIARTEFHRRNDSVAVLILLMLCGLAVMSMAHELLYQRSFWLLLGAALACPVGVAPASRQLSAAPPQD